MGSAVWGVLYKLCSMRMVPRASATGTVVLPRGPVCVRDASNEITALSKRLDLPT